MGNKIRVELSHGGGRTAKFAGDPGACFKCAQMGHWARFGVSFSPSAGSDFYFDTESAPIIQAREFTFLLFDPMLESYFIISSQRRQNYDPPLIDRIQRDYNAHPSRNIPPRDDFPQRLPPRDGRYDYPPSGAVRDNRRPPSPRDYRDYGPGARVRDYDDFRRGPPPPAIERERFAPPSDFRGRYPPVSDVPYRGYGAPPPPLYERYERRPNDRYSSYSQPRPRTPSRIREDYDRVPPR